MAGVRRVVPLTLGWIDLPRHVLVQGESDEQVRVPVPGVLLQADGGWLLLDTGFNTALITDTALRRRFHGDPAMRPIIPGPGEPLDEALDKAGVDIGDIRAVAVSHLHWDHAGGLRHFAGRVPVHVQRAELEFATQPGPVPERRGMFRVDYDDPRISWQAEDGDTRDRARRHRHRHRRAHARATRASSSTWRAAAVSCSPSTPRTPSTAAKGKFPAA